MEYRQLSKDEFADLADRILYEDNHLLVVCKRVGEITQGDKTGDECLTEAYKAFIAQRDAKPGKVFLGLPHRLDRPVSGVCLLAKTSKAPPSATAKSTRPTGPCAAPRPSRAKAGWKAGWSATSSRTSPSSSQTAAPRSRSGIRMPSWRS